MRQIVITAFVLACCLLFSCQPQSEPIEYGTDVCNHCKMTIVDKKFAAQAVTDKGKIYNFDAIECLVQFTDEKSDIEFEILEVKSFIKPDNRVNARQAYYVKSPEIPSPMGGYLSAYPDEKAAKEKATHPEAKVMSWEELNAEVLQ